MANGLREPVSPPQKESSNTIVGIAGLGSTTATGGLVDRKFGSVYLLTSFSATDNAGGIGLGPCLGFQRPSSSRHQSESRHTPEGKVSGSLPRSPVVPFYSFLGEGQEKGYPYCNLST